MDNLRFVRKTLSELTKEEISELRLVCNSSGAFKAILNALSSNKIDCSNKISLSILYNDNVIMGWIFIDPVKEYNDLAADDEVSVMIYVSPKFRGMKIANKLIVEEKENLIGKKLLAYPSKKSKPFFFKMNKTHNLNFIIKEPVLYYKRG